MAADRLILQHISRHGKTPRHLHKSRVKTGGGVKEKSQLFPPPFLLVTVGPNGEKWARIRITVNVSGKCFLSLPVLSSRPGFDGFLRIRSLSLFSSVLVYSDCSCPCTQITQSPSPHEPGPSQGFLLLQGRFFLVFFCHLLAGEVLDFWKVPRDGIKLNCADFNCCHRQPSYHVTCTCPAHADYSFHFFLDDIFNV